MESVWYYVVNGVQTGPVSWTELKEAAATGKLSPPDLVWKEGEADWVPARTVAELFPAAPPPLATTPTTYSLSPPPPPPPPFPNVPASLPRAKPVAEALSLDDEPSSPKSKSRPRREREPESNPPPQLPEWVKLIPIFLLRVFHLDPSQATPIPDEDAKLTRAGVMEVTARKFAVWRRSALFVAAVPCAFAAFFGVINVLDMEKSEKEIFSLFGMFLLYLQALALFALPVAAVFGALAYDRFSLSTKWVVAGGLISFGVPLTIAFVPSDWLIELKTTSSTTVGQVEAMKSAVGVSLGIEFYLLLLPMVLSLLPAVSRACVRMKLFLPESLVPGWGLVTSAPLCVLLTLATFVLLYHIAGNALLIAGLLLWIAAPLLFLTNFNLFTRPITSPADQAAIIRTSFIVLCLIIAGVILLVIYLFTARIPLVGMTLVGFDDTTSVLRPWSLRIHKKWIEYVGRSLFLSVFFSDLILRMALSVWREARAFAGTAESASFDRTMSGLDSATLPRG